MVCTVTQLYHVLQSTATDSMIDTYGKMSPKSASVLSRMINEVKTILRSKGITIEAYLADTSTGVRGIKICKVQSESSEPSENGNHEGNTGKISDGILTDFIEPSANCQMPPENNRGNYERITSDIQVLTALVALTALYILDVSNPIFHMVIEIASIGQEANGTINTAKKMGIGSLWKTIFVVNPRLKLKIRKNLF